LFRDTKLQKEEIEKYPDFEFHNKGSLAYLGDGKGDDDNVCLISDNIGVVQ
jgi:hypothetical protein